jgi:signal transduction histidine kinase
MRSFRTTLALRVGLGTLALALVLALGGMLFLRARLLSNLDASLLELAELESAYGADSVSAGFQFRQRHFRRPDFPGEREFWAQLLSSEGLPLVLSANLSAPLPIPDQAALGTAALNQPSFTTQRARLRGSSGVREIAIRTVMYPMGRAGPSHADHRLQVSTSLAPSQAEVGQFALPAIGIALIAAIFAGVGTFLIAGRALTPALEISRVAESIGVRELSRRVTVPGDLAEFHRIAVAFNGLLDRIEQAVTGTRRFTADASHELRAPLTVLRGELELALSRPRSAGEYEEVLRRCLDEVMRLTRLADDLLTLARVEGGVIGGARNPLDLDELVGRAVARRKSLADDRGVALEVSGTAGDIRGDADLLVRALDGLLEHAIMASPQGGAVRVRLADGDARSVQVTDTGPGLLPAEVSGIFQRFYRSKRSRIRSEESGLGLAIARAVAQRHGGSVVYEGNDPGAAFRLSLPIPTVESEG